MVIIHNTLWTNYWNVASYTARDFLSWSTHRVMSCLVIAYTSFGKGPHKCPREPLVFFFRAHTHTHTHTHTPSFLSLLPLPSSLTPIALARNTAPCFSWQNSAGCPCVPEKPAFSPSSLQPTRTFLTFSACSLWTVHFSLLTSSRLPGKAGQGGTNTSSHLHYIHILPVSLPLSPKSLYNSLSLHPNLSLWWLLALFALSERASRAQVCKCLCYCSLVRKSC